MPCHNTWDVVEFLQVMKCHQITFKSFNNRNCFQEFYFVTADVLRVLQSVTVHCRCSACYAMLYVPWRICGLSPRREKRFLCFSECPAYYLFSTRSSFWWDTKLSAWSWRITISSAKVQICFHSSWLGAFAYRIHGTLSFWSCVLSHGVTRRAKFVLSVQVTDCYLPVVQKKNVIPLHFLSSSLWNWYNKFVNDWCVFGEVCVNILSCVLSSKLY